MINFIENMPLQVWNFVEVRYGLNVLWNAKPVTYLVLNEDLVHCDREKQGRWAVWAGSGLADCQADNSTQSHSLLPTVRRKVNDRPAAGRISVYMCVSMSSLSWRTRSIQLLAVGLFNTSVTRHSLI